MKEDSVKRAPRYGFWLAVWCLISPFYVLGAAKVGELTFPAPPNAPGGGFFIGFIAFVGALAVASMLALRWQAKKP